MSVRPAGIAGLLVVAWTALARSGSGPTVFEVSVWAAPGAEKDPRVLRVFDHPACSGRVAVLRTTSIPTKGPFRPELVIEFTEAGHALRKWPMPVDAYVAGIRGDQIIVPRTLERVPAAALSITPTGRLSASRVPTESGNSIACPVLPEFKGSAYLQCFEFHDLGTGAIRRLAYEGPCT